MEELGEELVPINNDLERSIADMFAIFDHTNNQTIDSREIGTIVRALGCVPTEAELQEMLVKMENPEIPGTIHLAAFIPIVEQAITEHKFMPASPDQLLEAFQLLDVKGIGYFTKEQFCNIVTQEGEPFSQDELDEMLEIAIDPQSQTVPYEYYINQLMHELEDGKVYAQADRIEEEKKAAAVKAKMNFTFKKFASEAGVKSMKSVHSENA